jgi:hypothetical protein
LQSINPQKFDRELKKGGAELLVLSLSEARPRQGWESFVAAINRVTRPGNA